MYTKVSMFTKARMYTKVSMSGLLGAQAFRV
jgi:hypothetical protein